jgi:SAM-dependent methyltransferase
MLLETQETAQIPEGAQPLTGLSAATLDALVKASFLTSSTSGSHITRYAMYQALRGALTQFDHSGKRVLSISNSVAFGRTILGIRRAEYTEADYPEYNILGLPFKNGSFDFCISDQVLEHVEGSPFTAFNETSRILRTGGYVCHTTCFVNPIHKDPGDYWRFTPDALRLLCENSGCEVITLGGWGNREAWSLINGGYRFAQIPDDPTNPLHQVATRNELAWPITVWVIGRKRPE